MTKMMRLRLREDDVAIAVRLARSQGISVTECVVRMIRTADQNSKGAAFNERQEHPVEK